MAERIISMRALLRQHLEDLKNPLPWKHVTEQIGMFCFSGISPEQARPEPTSFPEASAPSLPPVSWHVLAFWQHSRPHPCHAGGPPGAGLQHLHDAQWPHLHGGRHHQKRVPPGRGPAQSHY